LRPRHAAGRFGEQHEAESAEAELKLEPPTWGEQH
jgi:hypothetical protein